MTIPEKHCAYILLYAVLGALAACTALTLVGLMALSEHYKEHTNAELSLALNARVSTVEQYLTRASDIGLQITSRTKVRDSLEDYNRGTISLPQFVQFAAPILKDAMNLSRDIAGISRFDANSQLAVQIGLMIPAASFTVPAASDRKTVFLAPVFLADEGYLPVFTPIISRRNERVGTDLILFRTRGLQESLTDPAGWGETDETILAVADNGNLRSLLPRRDGAAEILPGEGRVGAALAQAIAGHQGLLRPGDNQAEFIAFAPLSAEGWGLAVSIDAAELQAPEKRASRLLVFFAVAITASGIGFMLLLLRPLVRALRKETAERLTAQQQTLTILNSLDALVYVADMQSYELLFINRFGRKIFGDIEGKICWQALQSGQDGPCSFCTNDHLLDPNGKPTGVYAWEFQNTVTSAWFECRDQAIPWSDGRLVRMEIATEITARKQAEDRAFSLAKIIENSLSEVYIFDRETLRFVFVNLGARENLGYQMDELSALTPTDIKPDYTDAAFRELIRPLLNNETDILRFVTRHERKNGSCYPVEVSLQLSIYEKKQVFVANILDITARRQMEEELQRHREELEKLVEARTAELEKKNQDLERFNKLFVDRELRIKELKEQIKNAKNRQETEPCSTEDTD